MIGKPFYYRKFHGEYDMAGAGRFDIEERGLITVARIGTTDFKQERR